MNANENVVPFPAQSVEVEFGTEQAAEYAQYFRQGHSDLMNSYLKQWPEGPVEPQEITTRMDGALLAAEANLRATLQMVASGLGTCPVALTNMILSRLSMSIAADIMDEQGSVQ